MYKTKIRNKKHKGQSTLEYIILVAAIIALAILFLQDGGAFRTALNGVWGQGTTSMSNMGARLAGSRPLAP